MSIIGLGIDLVNIERIEKSISGKSGQKFINRIFTQFEQGKAANKPNLAAFYAKRFAAKEAFVKALGTGIAQGIFWTDIEVHNDDLGKPYLQISGEALKKLEALTPQNSTVRVDLSLTDDKPFAQAMVLISLN